MATNADTLGKEISATLNKNVRSAKSFWTRVSEVLLDHLTDTLNLSELIDVVDATGASYTAKDRDAIILVYTVSSPGSRTVLLPTNPAHGRMITVKDAGGYAATQNITVNPGTGKTIDGDLLDTLDAAWVSTAYVFSSGEWFKISGV